MGFFDSLRNLTKPYDDDDEYYDEDEGSLPPPQPDSQPQPRQSQGGGRSAFSGAYGDTPVRRSGGREEKVVNLNSAPQLKVVLVKPERFETAAEIADNLRDKCTVVMNLEQTNKDIARRLIDFLSGVAYAQDGKIKKVASSTYIITPYNVDLAGDLAEELENSGLYF
ncbi:MAG: cell division protein SepF [Firmicutes bacterium]|nr:cell division protein SepF [Bacillota bacterium]